MIDKEVINQELIALLASADFSHSASVYFDQFPVIYFDQTQPS